MQDSDNEREYKDNQVLIVVQIPIGFHPDYLRSQIRFHVESNV